jgi:hypothetical protein
MRDLNTRARYFQGAGMSAIKHKTPRHANVLVIAEAEAGLD